MPTTRGRRGQNALVELGTPKKRGRNNVIKQTANKKPNSGLKENSGNSANKPKTTKNTTATKAKTTKNITTTKPKTTKSVASNRSTSNKKDNSTTQQQQELDAALASFDKLKEKRYTEVEKLYEDLQEKSNKQQEVSNKLIQQLRADKKRLEAKIKRMNSQSKRSTTKSSTESVGGVSDQRVADLKQVIKFYQTMTGIDITMDNAENSYVCEITGRDQIPAISCEVKLGVDEEDEQEEGDFVMYNPTHIAFDNDKLPEFLTEQITFAASEGPVFLAQAITEVFKMQ